jgi:hypothetical protein
VNDTPTGILAEVMRKGAKVIGENFTDPDDDWAPVMMYLGGDGQVRDAVIEISEDDEGRDQVAAQITRLLLEARAREACFIVSTWVVDLPEGNFDALEGKRPREHSDRREALTLTWVTRDHAQMEMARIKRYPGQPPKLAAWYPPATGISVVGRFIDAMRAGITDDES